jgi:hypothetical protein
VWARIFLSKCGSRFRAIAHSCDRMNGASGGKVDMREKLSEISESLNGTINEVVATPHRQQEWHGGAIGLRLVERYIKEELYLVVIFRSRRGSGDFATFLKRSIVEVGGPHDIHWPASATRCEPHRNQAAMLVEIVELVESPEIVISSSVRVHPLDDLLDILPHSVHLSVKSGYLFFGRRDVLGDWKCGKNSGLFDAGSFDQFPRKIVQTTVEILDNVTHDDRDGFGKGISFHDIKNPLASVRVFLSGNAIRARILEFPENDFEFIDMLVGPLDF